MHARSAFSRGLPFLGVRERKSVVEFDCRLMAHYDISRIPQRASPDVFDSAVMHWGFLFIWIIGAWLVWALLQDNRICFGSAQLSDEAFEEMPFRGIGIMDDDQRAASLVISL